MNHSPKPTNKSRPSNHIARSNRQSARNESNAIEASSPPSAQSDDQETWKDHEHVADEAKIAAQKLVNAAGSVALAKQALRGAEEPAVAEASMPRERLAADLGFVSYLELFEASMPVNAPNGDAWLTVSLGSGRWVVWSEKYLGATHEFGSRSDAEGAIRSGRVSAK